MTKEIEREHYERSRRMAETSANLERKARELYEIWLHRTGLETPFDRLAPRAREAWFEVANRAFDDPECVKCGAPLVCHSCLDKGI